VLKRDAENLEQEQFYSYQNYRS